MFKLPSSLGFLGFLCQRQVTFPSAMRTSYSCLCCCCHQSSPASIKYLSISPLFERITPPSFFVNFLSSKKNLILCGVVLYSHFHKRASRRKASSFVHPIDLTAPVCIASLFSSALASILRSSNLSSNVHPIMSTAPLRISS